MRIKNKNGFTLVELLMATMVTAILFTGVLLTYIRCIELNDLALHSSAAVSAVSAQVETIRNGDFAQVVANHHQTTFTSANLNGIGVSYVNNANPDLLDLYVTFCWQEKNGRVIGEDQDLDGVLDAGEDKNGNGRLDSPVTVATKLYDLS